MIDFKTYDEQIKILIDKNLVVDNVEDAKNILIKYNYYNIINAYKDVFIEKGKTPETFLIGTKFDDIKNLLIFDKELRRLFSEILIVIERNIKSIIAYEFTNTHRNHDYLNIYNFDYIYEPIKSSQLVTKLASIITNEQEKRNEMIIHYKAKYNVVPLWVLINILTFGNISYFFSCMSQKDRAQVCISLGNITGHKLNEKDVVNYVKILVLLRNRTAHDQRIFDFNSKVLTISQNHPFLNQYGITSLKNDLFAAITCIYSLTDVNTFENFTYNLKDLINKLSSVSQSNIFEKIYKIMGIPAAFLIK